MDQRKHLPRLLSFFGAFLAVTALSLPVLAQVSQNSGSNAPASTTQIGGQPIATAQTVAPTNVSGAVPASASDASGFAPYWVAAFQATDLWSSADASAQSIGPATIDSPLQVLAPQTGPRLYVSDPTSQTTAWVDATSVGPIGTPSDGELAALANQASAASAFQPFWVMNDQSTTLWSGATSDATALNRVPQWRYFQVVQPQQGSRAYVLDPRSNTYGWLDLSAVGPVGSPPDDYFQTPPPDDETLNEPARIIGTTNAYEEPEKANYFSLDRMTTNDSITVVGDVNAADGKWYHLDDGDYVPAANVRLPDPPTQTFTGRWIDASLTEPVIVTAYEGSTPVYAALAVKGTIANQTPTGVFHILRRVADETMNSETLSPPIPRNAPGGYYLQHVLDTQYFTGDGASIHYNYWYANWGYAGSHGCLGMNLADATFFWNFADIGTPVDIHS